MITLRELTAADLATLNGWRNDPDLVGSLEAPFRYINLETDQAWFDHYLANRARNVRCAICPEGHPETMIGTIGLTNIDAINRSADFYLMIGSRQHWGQGVGRQATMTLLRHAFLNLNLHRIQLTVLESNERARRLYESVGFRHEGIRRDAVYKHGRYTNILVMGLLSGEFQGGLPDLPTASTSE